MIRWLIRLIFGVVILGLVLATAALLLKDTILKELIQKPHSPRDGHGRANRESGCQFSDADDHDRQFKALQSGQFLEGRLALSMPELHLEYEN